MPRRSAIPAQDALSSVFRDPDSDQEPSIQDDEDWFADGGPEIEEDALDVPVNSVPAPDVVPADTCCS